MCIWCDEQGATVIFHSVSTNEQCVCSWSEGRSFVSEVWKAKALKRLEMWAVWTRQYFETHTALCRPQWAFHYKINLMHAHTVDHILNTVPSTSKQQKIILNTALLYPVSVKHLLEFILYLVVLNWFLLTCFIFWQSAQVTEKKYYGGNNLSHTQEHKFKSVQDCLLQNQRMCKEKKKLPFVSLIWLYCRKMHTCYHFFLTAKN